MSFGKEVRKQFFLDEDYVPLNNGSYGAVPRRVAQKQSILREEVERNPDNFYRRRNIQMHIESLHVASKILGANAANIVFVENVTTGLVTAVKSIPWEAGDQILLTSLTYHAVNVLGRCLRDELGIEIVSVPLKFPLTNKEEILETYERFLSANKRIKAAVIDHITSPSSVLLPVKEISEVCHKHNCLVVVDGAHCMGQLKLNVEDLGVDYYSGNFHKWMFAPRGCAILYVAPQHQGRLNHPVTSHFYSYDSSNRPLHFDFVVRSTIDHTPYHCLSECVSFIDDLGGLDSIINYNTSLMEKSVKRLTSAWGTEELSLAPEYRAPFMRLIRVPDMPNYPKTFVGGSDLETDIFNRHNMQVLCMPVDGELYIRLSLHIYNCEEDVEKLEEVVKELQQESYREKPKKPYDLPIMHWDLSPVIHMNSDCS